nr:hypothetical protein [Tanacetum cinerariifolium]
GFRAVGEDVAQVSAAAATVDFLAQHAERGVGADGRGVVQWLPEAGPAGVAVELGARGKQRQLATGAGERARAVLVVQRAAVRALDGVMVSPSANLGSTPSAMAAIPALPLSTMNCLLESMMVSSSRPVPLSDQAFDAMEPRLGARCSRNPHRELNNS